MLHVLENLFIIVSLVDQEIHLSFVVKIEESSMDNRSINHSSQLYISLCVRIKDD